MKRTVISQSTLVPISLVMALTAGIYQFAQVSLATEQNKTDVDQVSSSVKEMQKSVVVSMNDQSANVNEIRTQLLLMDVKLNALTEAIKSLRADGRRLRARDD